MKKLSAVFSFLFTATCLFAAPPQPALAVVDSSPVLVFEHLDNLLFAPGEIELRFTNVNKYQAFDGFVLQGAAAATEDNYPDRYIAHTYVNLFGTETKAVPCGSSCRQVKKAWEGMGSDALLTPETAFSTIPSVKKPAGEYPFNVRIKYGTKSILAPAGSYEIKKAVPELAADGTQLAAGNNGTVVSMFPPSVLTDANTAKFKAKLLPSVSYAKLFLLPSGGQLREAMAVMEITDNNEGTDFTMEKFKAGVELPFPVTSWGGGETYFYDKFGQKTNRYNNNSVVVLKKDESYDLVLVYVIGKKVYKTAPLKFSVVYVDPNA